MLWEDKKKFCLYYLIREEEELLNKIKGIIQTNNNSKKAEVESFRGGQHESEAGSWGRKEIKLRNVLAF